MTVSELIETLKNYDSDMQVIMPDGAFYEFICEDGFQTKVLYPDLTDVDSSCDDNGESETYLMITTNQLN